MPDLLPKTSRAALEVLPRDRLAAIADRFNLTVEDRRSHAAHVDAIIRARSVDFADLLRLLSRDDLKAICEALDLDTAGKEKEPIIQRILGVGAGESQQATSAAVASAADASTPPAKATT